MRPLFFVVALAFGGCARRVDVVVSPHHIGTPFARVTNYMAWLGRQTEGTPAGVPNDALLDEITLTSVTDSEFCGDVVLRTPAIDDQPLSQLDVACAAVGGPPGAFANEELQYIDYDYSGRSTVFRAEALGPLGMRSFEITQPAEYAFRVAERHAQLCCPTSGFGVIRVRIVNRSMPGRFVATWEVRR
jgi:hypothetical protein